jgi:hypothetical protein
MIGGVSLYIAELPGQFEISTTLSGRFVATSGESIAGKICSTYDEQQRPARCQQEKQAVMHELHAIECVDLPTSRRSNRDGGEKARALSHLENVVQPCGSQIQALAEEKGADSQQGRSSDGSNAF